MLKLDSRQHCTKKKKKASQLPETYPLTNYRCVPSYVMEYTRKKKIKQFPEKNPTTFLLGKLQHYLTKDKHAGFYNIDGHDEKKRFGTTQQNTGEWNAAHRWSLKQAYAIQLPCQQKMTYKKQTGTT